MFKSFPEPMGVVQGYTAAYAPQQQDGGQKRQADTAQPGYNTGYGVLLGYHSHGVLLVPIGSC